MDINEKLSRYYHEYQADMEAARIAERKGNTEGAYQLYRSAARYLCEMAEMESGETKRERVLHAEQVMKKANSLRQSAGSAASQAAGPSSSSAPKSSAAAGAQTSQAGSSEDNPWKSESIPDTTFDDVIGMEDVKALIRKTIINQFRYPEKYNAFGLEGGTGVLLFGLPGTGKTTVARAVAHEISAPLYIVSPSDVLNKWVGESERIIRQLFEKARETPRAMIFFDDFDILGQKRQEDGNYSNKIIGELIIQMDGFRRNANTILLMAATNKPWMIDSALMRPGRFEHHIYVPLADHEMRKAMIEKNMKGVPMEPGIDFDAVSDLMEGYNGADILSVLKAAKMAGLNREIALAEAGQEGSSPVTFADFSAAAAMHKSSVVQEDIVKIRKYAMERGITLPDKM